MNKRTEYIEKLSAQMVEWDMQIDQLKIKATSASPEQSLEYSQAIKALQLKRDEAAHKLQNMPVSSDRDWEALKSGLDQIWSDFATMLRDVFKKFK